MKKKNVLWVDDSINDREFKDVLDRFGEVYEVKAFSNVDNFLNYTEKIATSAEDVMGIIIDVMMPAGDILNADETDRGLKTGIVLAKRLRNEESIFKKTPIVICSLSKRFANMDLPWGTIYIKGHLDVDFFTKFEAFCLSLS